MEILLLNIIQHFWDILMTFLDNFALRKHKQYGKQEICSYLENS